MELQTADGGPGRPRGIADPPGFTPRKNRLGLCACQHRFPPPADGCGHPDRAGRSRCSRSSGPGAIRSGGSLPWRGDYGDVVEFRGPAGWMFLLNDPDLIREVLVSQSKRFAKGRALERIRPVLGTGLLTSEGEFHRRQRRLMQPAFHHQRLSGFAATMIAHADRLTRGWQLGETRDLAGEMMRLTLSIVGETLLGAEVDAEAARVRDALGTIMHSFPMLMLPFSAFLQRLPLPVMRRMRAAQATLDAIIYALIDERRADGADHGDLLSMLLAAQDPESEDLGVGMSNVEVRDEVMTVFLAGHETTANALAWTWHLLAGQPEAEARLHDEIRRVLPDGRAPTDRDLPALVFTEQVVSEALRLYPPAWLISRRALEPCLLGGYTVPTRSIVVMSQWVTHRDARWFPEPERFDPGRWTPEFKAALPRYAFFPFGGGPRRCIGEGFAWMELVLLVARIAQRWRFVREPDAPPVLPEALITLRPAGGLPMRLERMVE